ncbi:uncharacterized protein LOC114755550 [Neltuma alba]|uniref:uncharacterized protein LOC114755550 n=1 Tax=Neltuma alba TaxID=207710 RepID=UPI0010A3456E|nr:uncharacterized protein LOC114755550 [Prosopis alba]
MDGLGLRWIHGGLGFRCGSSKVWCCLRFIFWKEKLSFLSTLLLNGCFGAVGLKFIVIENFFQAGLSLTTDLIDRLCARVVIGQYDLFLKVSSKREVVKALIQRGFSNDVAQWVVTNLQPTSPFGSRMSSFSWMFDLKAIAEMYQSYEETNLWKIVENVPRGVHMNFLKAERSLHRWALEDLERIHAAEELAAEEGGGVEMHVLEDAGHWVHADNPDGLFRILYSSFQGVKT